MPELFRFDIQGIGQLIYFGDGQRVRVPLEAVIALPLDIQQRCKRNRWLCAGLAPLPEVKPAAGGFPDLCNHGWHYTLHDLYAGIRGRHFSLDSE